MITVILFIVGKQSKDYHPGSLGLEAPLEILQASPAQAGSPGAGGTCPGGLGMSPERENPAAPGLCPFHGTKFFLMLRWKWLYFSFWPFLPVLGTTEQCGIVSDTPQRYLYGFMGSPLSPLIMRAAAFSRSLQVQVVAVDFWGCSFLCSLFYLNKPGAGVTWFNVRNF